MLVTASVIPLVFFIIACQDQVMDDLNAIAMNSSVALDVPRHVQDRYDQLSKENPDSRYVIVEVQNGGLSKLKEMEQQYGQFKSVEIIRTGEQISGILGNAAVNEPTDTSVPVTLERSADDDSRTFAIIEFTDQVRTLSAKAMLEGEIYLVVEETANPAEGMEKLYQFVTENMSYPSQAKKAGIEGRVFIEFVVEKDGTLTNFKSLKGIGHGCDEEAIRVLAMSPPWKPGLQHGEPVRQKMVMPVTFEL